MKKTFFILLALGIFAPFSSFAFNSEVGENLNLSTPISDDYYVAGGTTNLNTSVKGDLAIIGGKNFINGNIGDDLMVLGGENIINGNIGETARIMGGKIFFQGTINKDLLFQWGEIHIGENSTIQGESNILGGKAEINGTMNKANITAGEITLKGIIKGDATIKTNKIKVEEGAKILGNLYYEAPMQNTGLEQIVGGTVTYKQAHLEYNSIAKAIGSRFAFLSILGLILLFIGQKRIRPSLETVKKYPRQSLGYGALAYIGLPIAAIICMITVIGMPFAFVLIATFITLLIFAKLLNVYFYTNLLIEKRGGEKKLNKRKKIGILLGCAIISAVINGIDIIFTFFAVGAIIKTHILKKK